MQSVCQFEFQVLSTCSPTPNVLPRQIHPATPECILIIPGGFPSTFHILEDTLKKVVTQKVVERTQIRILDVVQLQDLTCNVVIARNEWGDDITTLL